MIIGERLCHDHLVFFLAVTDIKTPYIIFIGFTFRQVGNFKAFRNIQNGNIGGRVLVFVFNRGLPFWKINLFMFIKLEQVQVKIPFISNLLAVIEKFKLPAEAKAIRSLSLV